METRLTGTQVDFDQIVAGVKLMLKGLGEDINREGLRDTPERVARMWQEFAERRNINYTLFSENVETDELILVSMPLASLCEHHILPFVGEIHVGYIPNDKGVLGLSKLARIVDKHALRLTIQERLVADVAQEIQDVTNALGVGVVAKAEHLCMSLRGVRKPGHQTITSKLLGVLMEKGAARSEFMSLIK